jgi:hypothetical protein
MEWFVNFVSSNLFSLFVCLLFAAVAMSGKFSYPATNVLLLITWLVGCLTIVRSGIGDYRLIAAGVLFVGGICFLLSFWLSPPQPVAPAPAVAVVPPPEPEKRSISVQYADTALPVPLPPRATTYVVQLHPEIFQFVQEMRNDSSRTVFYPKKPNSPADRLFMCELENHGNDDFVDIRLLFKVGYFEVDQAQFKDVTNKDGTKTVTFEKPAGIPVQLIQKKGKIVGGIKQGKLVTVQQREISLRTIRAHGAVKLYFINYSPLWASFTFPSEMTAIVGGNVQRISVTMIRPQVNPLDLNYVFPVPPARYEWREVFPGKKKDPVKPPVVTEQ